MEPIDTTTELSLFNDTKNAVMQSQALGELPSNSVKSWSWERQNSVKSSLSSQSYLSRDSLLSHLRK